jgi:hypothetical protein
VASDKIKNLNEINLNYKIHNIPPTTSPNIDLLNVGSNSLINLGGCTNSDHYTDPYIKRHSIIFINTTKLNYLSKLSRFDSDDKKSTTILWEGVFEYDGKNTEVNMIWECTTFKDYPYRFEIKTHPEKWIKKKIDDKYPLNQIRKTASDAAYLNFDFDAGKSYTIEYCYSVSIPENICEDQYGTTNIAYSKAATSLVFK